MSLIDLASLVLAPTATKEGKVYSAIPNTGDGDMTFSRGSAATRVNSAGLIEKVRTNLALYSEEFDNAAYVKLFSSITANSIANPLNGATTADKIVEDTANNLHRVGQGSMSVVSGQIYTFSFYAKEGERNELELQRINTSGTVFNSISSTTANLTLGTLTVGSNVTASSIESVGNGWYRISVSLTAIATGSGGLNIGLMKNGNVSYLGDGTSGAFIFGFQAETGDIATDYIPTTTTAVSVGITDDVPRVDYSGGGCPKLLLEPQRTNLVTFSEQIDNAAWTKTGVTISSNATTSPDGTTSADKIIANAISGSKTAFQARSITTGQAFTISAFFKKSEYKLAFVRAGGQTDSPYVIYNLDTQVVVSTSGASSTKIEDYGNGWYRILFTLNSATGGTCAPNVSFLPDSGYTLSSLNVPQYTGDGTSGGFVWGCQLEANGASYATSYIPTYGVSSTRVADFFLKSNASNLIGQTEGTIFIEFTRENNSVGTFSISANNVGTRIYIGTNATGLICQVRNGYAQQAYFSTAQTEGTKYKCAIAYATNDFVLYMNGTQIGTDTSGTVPPCDTIRTDDAGGSNLNQPLSQAILFPTRLTNDQLADLTTL
jgi:hypothetical protein